MRCVLFTVALFVVLLVSSPVAASRSGPPQTSEQTLRADLERYHGMVVAYRRGDDKVVSELLTWDASRLELTIGSLNSPKLDPNQPWSDAFLRSGVLLQTAAALNYWDARNGSRMTMHFNLGVAHLRLGSSELESFGTAIAGLTAADFELRDSGVLQEINSASLADVPVSMSLVLDTSESVKGATLSELKSAAIAAVSELAEVDRVSLATFNSSVHLQNDWTSTQQEVRETIERADAGGGTSLYDAAFARLLGADTVSGNRQLMLLFSDGMDTGSWLPPSAAIDSARRSEMVVYSVVLGGHSSGDLLFRRSGIELLERPVAPSVRTPFLTDLADTTGGNSYVSESAGGLRRLFARIVGEFRTRYLLTYTPRAVDRAGWHPIEVKLKTKKGKVSARRGYMR
jgi:VWFA-related protein